MTSLSRQLQQLSTRAAPLKQRASLVFDVKEAGDIDRETIYAMSLKALKEMQKKNPMLIQFNDTLFSEQLKSQDRSQLTASDNDSLNTSLSLFLRILSPSYLVADTFKVLEYLVRRFKIQEYNIEAILECIIPFHETTQFVKFVKLLVIPAASRFAFLTTVQKSQVPLSRLLIVELCVQDPSVLDFIIQTEKRSRVAGIKNIALSALYGYTLLQYFHLLSAIKDNHIRLVLPSILEGLEGSEKNNKAAMQMVVSILVKKVALEEGLKNSIITSLVNGMTESDLYTDILMLLVMAQSQGELAIPVKSLITLLSFKSFNSSLIKGLAAYDGDVFGISVCKCLLDLVSTGNDLALQSLTLLMKADVLKPSSVGTIIDSLVLNLKSPYVVTILHALHSTNFVQIDDSISRTLANFQGTKNEKREYYQILTEIFNGSASETIQGANTTLFLALQHVKVDYRLLALHRLKDIMESSDASLNGEAEEKRADLKTFLGPVLESRLMDSTSVVKATLEIDGLASLVGSKTLLVALTNLVIDNDSPLIVVKAINLILDIVEVDETLLSNGVKHCLYGSLLHTCSYGADRKWVGRVLEFLKFAKVDSIVQDLEGDNNVLVLQSIIQSFDHSHDNYFLHALESKNVNMRVFSCLVLNRLACDLKLTLQDIQKYVQFLKSRFQSLKKIELDEGILKMTKGFPNGPYLNKIKPQVMEKFEPCLFVVSFACLIAKCPIGAPNWFVRGIYEEVVVEMFKGIFMLSRYQNLLLTNLLAVHVGSQVLEFSMSLSLTLADDELKCACLDIAKHYLQTALDLKKCKDFQLILPALLISLRSPTKAIQIHALALTVVLSEVSLEMSKEKSSSSHIYGYDHFYGPTTTQVQYLRPKTVSNLASNLTDLRVDLKETLKEKEILTFLLTNVLAIPVQKSILLDLVEEVGSSLKVKVLSKLFDKEIRASYIEGSDGQLLVTSLIKCLSSAKKVDFRALLSHESESEVYNCLVGLELFQTGWYKSLDADSQREGFSCLIDLVAFAPAVINTKAKLILKSLDPTHSIVSYKLDEIHSDLCEEESSKRVRVEGEAEGTRLYQLVSFLEYLHLVKPTNTTLITPIVTLLSKLFNFSASNLEYPKQLILSYLEGLFTTIPQVSELSEEALRADLVVQCIRVTENPQTHNAALLLLAAMGRTHPSIILLNIMPVFTFMGANILRQDDSYSFHVVQQTLETIIPSLLREGGEEELVYVKSVMDVFVDAVAYIPKHRRVRLFKVLVDTLGVKYLGPLVTLLLACPIIAKEKPMMPFDQTVNYTKFATRLLQEFDERHKLLALVGITEVFKVTPDTNEVQEVPAVIDAALITTKTIRLVKLDIIYFVNSTFKAMVQANGLGSEDTNSDIHRELLSAHLDLITTYTEVSGKYSKLVLTALYSNLDTINSILSMKVFSEVVVELLHSTDLMIQRRAVRILQERVLAMSPGSPLDDSLTKGALEVFMQKRDSLVGLENKQYSMICLGVMVARFGEESPEKYTMIFNDLIGEHGLLYSDKAVAATAMATVGPFVRCLKTRAVPYLPRFVPHILQYVEQSGELVVLRDSGLATLEALFETIPQFMSFYLPRIIVILSTFEKVEELVKSIPANVEHRVLFPAFFKVGLVSSKALHLLQSIIGNALQSSLVEYAKEYTKLFITLLDTNVNDEESCSEQEMVDVFIKYTMKLNEKSFKPLYMRVVQWGFSKPTNRLRLFRLTDELLEALKSIFVPYFSLVLDTALSSIEVKEHTLWHTVMATLEKCFRFDNNGFVTSERFEKIIGPLVAQVDRVKVFGVDYRAKMQNSVVPTLGQLMRVMQTESAWKALNRAVLMKSRNEDANVRLTVLKVISEFYLQLGEEMLVFFPETIPFLAEMLEDDDEEVQALCKVVCTEIQVYLGEPIIQYFSA